MDITNLKQLEAAINKKIANSLKNEVAKVARQEMQIQIQETVYDVYEPMHPENRRMYNDGLIDADNIEISLVGDDAISLENIAYDGSRNVPYIVESGEGYYAGAPDVLTRGRKFTEATRDSLRTSDDLKVAMKKGLKRQGLNVE